MKIRNFLLIFFLITSISLISCNKDSKSGSGNNAILGKWTLESIREKITNPPTAPAPSTDKTESGDGETWNFMSGDKIESCDPSGCVTEFYKVSGNTLLLSEDSDFSDNDINPYIIQNKTNNKLTLYYKDTTRYSYGISILEEWLYFIK